MKVVGRTIVVGAIVCAVIGVMDVGAPREVGRGQRQAASGGRSRKPER